MEYAARPVTENPIYLIVLFGAQIGLVIWLSAGIQRPLQATSLPFIVAAAKIGGELHEVSEATAAALVAGGVLSVLLSPAVARALLRQARWSTA